MILIMKFHFPLRTMQNLSMSLLKIPVSQLVKRNKRIGGVHIDLREKKEKPRGNIELILIIDEVFGVHEVFPFRLRLVSGSGGGVLLFPLFVFAVAFEFGEERVEGDGLVVGRRESEVGTEFETAVTVGGVGVVVVVEGRVGREE